MYMFLYSLAIFLISFIFSLFVIWMRFFPTKNTHKHGQSMFHLDGITDGIFLGIACFEFIPHAISAAGALHINRELILFIIVAGSQLMYWIGVGYSSMFGDNECEAVCCPTDFRDSNGLVWPALLMLAVHSLFEGMALGIVEEHVFQTLLFSSIFIHKGLESMAFSNAAYNVLKDKYLLIISGFIFASLTPIGVYAGVRLTGSHSDSGMLSLILHTASASMFLFMGFNCMLSQHMTQKADKYWSHMISVFIGFAVVAGMTMFFHHHHH